MIIVITPENTISNETAIANRLLRNGLTHLHLRKPGATKETYENYIRAIDEQFHDRIVIHDHFELVEKYHLKGIHLKAKSVHDFTKRDLYTHVSISCHSTDELKQLQFRPTYAFLSPIFNSISKPGYSATFNLNELHELLTQLEFPVVALGGITADHAEVCWQTGFAGIALLGYIWTNPQEAITRFLRIFPTPVFTIAGFDPSSGAGVTADIKTFEYHRTYGLGVCSAVTFQNQDTYQGTQWITSHDILRQCDLLLQKFTPRYLKIGLIENFNTLAEIITSIQKRVPNIQIIWDPILKASAGEIFHTQADFNKLNTILSQLYLITPNTDEINTIFQVKKRGDEEIHKIQHYCKQHNIKVLWKGGHEDETKDTVSDILIEAEGVHTFSQQRVRGCKHGTGCALSAAITALLAQGYSLYDACRYGQIYMREFILSTPTLLGLQHLPAVKQIFTPENEAPIQTIRCKTSQKSMPTLQYITDEKEEVPIFEQVKAVCQGGGQLIQLRMKGKTTAEIVQIGKEIKKICQHHHALFIIDDDVQAALLLDADGLHVGKEDIKVSEARRLLGPDKIIGATCNTFEDILQAKAQGADYIGLGPYTYTTTKKKLAPVLGLNGYRKLMQASRTHRIDIPVYAIGGIREKDIPSLMTTGIKGIALSSLIKNSEDIATKTTEIINMINQTKQRQ